MIDEKKEVKKSEKEIRVASEEIREHRETANE